MVILCDICGADVTKESRHILEVNGAKVCNCDNCWMAISDWVQSNNAKEYCNQYKQDQDIEMGD